MADIEVLSSEPSSEWSEVVSNSEEEDGGVYFGLNGNFAPYRGEPLTDSQDADMAADEENEDGILPEILFFGLPTCKPHSMLLPFFHRSTQPVTSQGCFGRAKMAANFDLSRSTSNG